MSKCKINTATTVSDSEPTNLADMFVIFVGRRNFMVSFLGIQGNNS